MARVNNITIQHALNTGEKSIPGTHYKLDGKETNTAFGYHGCITHGCPDCFSDNREDTYHPLTKQSLNELYALIMKKKAYLENLGMKYVCIWEHEFQKLKNQNAELKQFIKQLDLMDRLERAFLGVASMPANYTTKLLNRKRSSTWISRACTHG